MSDIISDYADVLKQNNFELKPLLAAIFSSKDFYSEQNRGSHIKSPVELVISTYKKLGLNNTPGVPDFNQSTTALWGKRYFGPQQSLVGQVAEVGLLQHYLWKEVILQSFYIQI